jgi:hypothetical protein
MKTPMRFLFVVDQTRRRTGGHDAGVGKRTNSTDGREPQRTASRTALPRRSRDASRCRPSPSRTIGHSAVGTNAGRTVGVCRRFRGARPPVRQYDSNRRTLSRCLGRFSVAESPDRHDLEERSSRHTVRAVAGNLAEIGIVGDEINPAKELQTFPFAEDRLVLITPRDHVVSRQRSIY